MNNANANVETQLIDNVITAGLLFTTNPIANDKAAANNANTKAITMKGKTFAAISGDLVETKNTTKNKTALAINVVMAG